MASKLMVSNQLYNPNLNIYLLNFAIGFPSSPAETNHATNSAMSRAVALSTAISSRLIVDGKIKAKGLRMPPTLPEL